jgi:hypothetical protein
MVSIETLHFLNLIHIFWIQIMVSIHLVIELNVQRLHGVVEDI